MTTSESIFGDDDDFNLTDDVAAGFRNSHLEVLEQLNEASDSRSRSLLLAQSAIWGVRRQFHEALSGYLLVSTSDDGRLTPVAVEGYEGLVSDNVSDWVSAELEDTEGHSIENDLAGISTADTDVFNLEKSDQTGVFKIQISSPYRTADQMS